MLVTIFKNAEDKIPKQRDFNSFSDFISNFKPRITTDKSSVPLYTCGEYYPETIRGSKNVKSLTALVFDIDLFSQKASEDFIDSLPLDLEFFCHTTHSHNEAKGPWKYRLLFGLSRSVTPDEYKLLYKSVALEYKLPYDIQTTDVSRMYYLPSAISEDLYQSLYNNQNPIDVDSWLSRSCNTGNNSKVTPSKDIGISTNIMPSRESFDILPYDKFLKVVQKLQKEKAESLDTNTYELSILLQKALDCEPLSGEGGRDIALTRVIGSLMRSFVLGPEYKEHIRVLLRPSCAKMGEDKNKTYLDILDQKLDREYERAKEHIRDLQNANAEKFKTESDYPKTGDEIIDYFNSKYFMAKPGYQGSKVGYWLMDNGKAYLTDKESIKNETANRFYIDPKGRHHNSFNYWHTHEGRRYYDRAVFLPIKDTPKDQYNLFAGYKLKPVYRDWSVFREFWYKTICNSQKEIYDYMFFWLADLFQRPYKLPGIACILYSSTEGTGKNTFCDAIGSILGEELYVADCGYNSVFGHFNGNAEKALLININEAGAPTNDQMEHLKNAITGDKKWVEHKGINKYEVKNYSRYIITSNNMTCARISGSDRRHLIVEPNSDMVGDVKYWSTIHREIAEGCMEGLLYDLLHYDLENNGMDLTKPPTTLMKAAFTEQSLSEVVKFFKQYLQTTTKTEIETSDLYDEFLAINPRRTISRPDFEQELKICCPDIQETYVLRNDKKRLCFKFSSIEAARESFDKRLRLKTKWQ